MNARPILPSRHCPHCSAEVYRYGGRAYLSADAAERARAEATIARLRAQIARYRPSMSLGSMGAEVALHARLRAAEADLRAALDAAEARRTAGIDPAAAWPRH